MAGSADVASSAEDPGAESTVDDSEPVDTVKDEEPDPFQLVPLDGSTYVAARSAGERAAAEIRGTVFALAEARREIARTGSEDAVRRVQASAVALGSNAATMALAGEHIDVVQFQHRDLVEDHRQAARTFEHRLAVLYAHGPGRVVDYLVDGYDLAAARSKQILLDAVLAADQQNLVDTYVAATTDVVDVGVLADSLSEDRTDRTRLIEQYLTEADQAEAKAMRLLDADALLDDLAFPVAGDYSFVDTFLAPRMTGTTDVHRHQGIDIFAQESTPLVAVERGLVVRIGEVRLGGLRLWLVGESGAKYYYAHLSAFADIVDGQYVETGTVVGYVGNTGNARSTPHHVHFQVHPGGGNAVNAFPLLSQLASRDRDLLAGDQTAFGLCPRLDGVDLTACSGS